jgi:hypothetical protein
MKHTYTSEQHREYILMSRKVGVDWLEVFAGNTDFFSTHFWELLTEMWFHDKPVMVSNALRYMKSIKSPFTARKYLQKAIEGKLIVERKNPADDRSTLVELPQDIRKKLDAFFDKAIDKLIDTAAAIKD